MPIEITLEKFVEQQTARHGVTVVVDDKRYSLPPLNVWTEEQLAMPDERAFRSQLGTRKFNELRKAGWTVPMLVDLVTSAMSRRTATETDLDAYVAEIIEQRTIVVGTGDGKVSIRPVLLWPDDLRSASYADALREIIGADGYEKLLAAGWTDRTLVDMVVRETRLASEGESLAS